MIEDIAVNAIGGLLAAAAVYFVIERRLRLRRERQHREDISRDILESLRQELEHDRQVAGDLREHVPAGALPYDAFEVAGWDLLSQAAVVTTLEPRTLQTLFEAYRRLKGANDQHALLLDLMYGPTATVSALLAASPSTGESRDGREQLEKRRSDLRDRLVRRVEALEPHLESALEQITRDLDARRDSSGAPR